MIYDNHSLILSFVQTGHQFSCLTQWFRYFERCVCCQNYGEVIQIICDDKTYLFRGKIMLLNVVNITLSSQFLYIIYSADRQKVPLKYSVSRRCFTCPFSLGVLSSERVSGGIALYAKFKVPIAVTMNSTFCLLGSHAL